MSDREENIHLKTSFKENVQGPITYPVELVKGMVRRVFRLIIEEPPAYGRKPHAPEGPPPKAPKMPRREEFFPYQ
jgi:hypothetical protein